MISTDRWEKAKDPGTQESVPKVLEMLSGELWTASCSSRRALVRGPPGPQKQALGAECSALWAWAHAPHLSCGLGSQWPILGLWFTIWKWDLLSSATRLTLSQGFLREKILGLRCQGVTCRQMLGAEFHRGGMCSGQSSTFTWSLQPPHHNGGHP